MNINSFATKSLLLVLCIKMENFCCTPSRNKNLTLYYAQNCLVDFCGFCTLSLSDAVSSFSLFAITKFNFLCSGKNFCRLWKQKKSKQKKKHGVRLTVISIEADIAFEMTAKLLYGSNAACTKRQKNSYIQFKFHLRKSFQEFFEKPIFCCYSSHKRDDDNDGEQQCTFMKVRSSIARTSYLIHIFFAKKLIFSLPRFVILTKLQKQQMNKIKASRLFHL